MLSLHCPDEQSENQHSSKAHSAVLTSVARSSSHSSAGNSLAVKKKKLKFRGKTNHNVHPHEDHLLVSTNTVGLQQWVVSTNTVGLQQWVT